MLMLAVSHVCSSQAEAPYSAGGERIIQENLVVTPDTVKLDMKVPHFPDAVVPDVKVNPKDKSAADSADRAPVDGSPGVVPLPAESPDER